MAVADTVRCEITGLAHGGAGVARVDGRVIFVTGALPGETVLAQITDDSKAAWWRARTVEVETASPDRTPISCPAAAAGAGCCDLAYGTAAAIRRAKATILVDTLTRIGRLDPPASLVVDGIPGGQDGHGWRIRARLGVADDRSAIGFRAAGSNAVVPQRCAALTPQLTAALDDLDPTDLPAGAEVIAVHDDDGNIHLAEASPPRPKQKGGRAGGGGRAAAQRRRARPTGAPRVLAGDPTASYRIGDRRWQLPVDAFWQAHRGAAAEYAATASQWLTPWADGAIVWDLYGGAGVFTGAALDRGARDVHLVDTESAPLAAAQGVFADAPVHRHRAAVSADVLRDLPAPGVVVLDPPRSGAGNAVIDAVTAEDPEAILHVGCDPAAFARDIGRAVAAGYLLERIRALDAFPLTHHVEAMALLVRP